MSDTMFLANTLETMRDQVTDEYLKLKLPDTFYVFDGLRGVRGVPEALVAMVRERIVDFLLGILGFDSDRGPLGDIILSRGNTLLLEYINSIEDNLFKESRDDSRPLVSKRVAQLTTEVGNVEGTIRSSEGKLLNEIPAKEAAIRKKFEKALQDIEEEKIAEFRKLQSSKASLPAAKRRLEEAEDSLKRLHSFDKALTKTRMNHRQDRVDRKNQERHRAQSEEQERLRRKEEQEAREKEQAKKDLAEFYKQKTN